MSDVTCSECFKEFDVWQEHARSEVDSVEFSSRIGIGQFPDPRNEVPVTTGKFFEDDDHRRRDEHFPSSPTLQGLPGGNDISPDKLAIENLDALSFRQPAPHEPGVIT